MTCPQCEALGREDCGRFARRGWLFPLALFVLAAAWLVGLFWIGVL